MVFLNDNYPFFLSCKFVVANNDLVLNVSLFGGCMINADAVNQREKKWSYLVWWCYILICLCNQMDDDILLIEKNSLIIITKWQNRLVTTIGFVFVNKKNFFLIVIIIDRLCIIGFGSIGNWWLEFVFWTLIFEMLIHSWFEWLCLYLLFNWVLFTFPQCIGHFASPSICIDFGFRFLVALM